MHQGIPDFNQVPDIGKNRIVVIEHGFVCNYEYFLVLVYQGGAIKVLFVSPFLTDGFKEIFIFFIGKEIGIICCISIKLD